MSSTKTIRIRSSAARALSRMARLLFDLDVIEFEELGAVNAALMDLTRSEESSKKPERLLTLEQVAERLAIGVSSAKRYLSTNELQLPKVRIGGNVRFRDSDLEKLILASTETKGGEICK